MLKEHNIDTGNAAERYVANAMSNKGFWVGMFSKSASGSQPFDHVAISSELVYAYDVKHTTVDRLDFVRVESNQNIALNFIEGLNNQSVRTGFAIVYKNIIYFLPLWLFNEMKKQGKKSVRVSTLSQMLEVVI